MTDGRCDLILLGWTAFVGFNLIFDFLWNGGQPATEDVGETGLGNPSAVLYHGDYLLWCNGSVASEGSLRLTVIPQATSVATVSVSTVKVALMQKAKDTSEGSTFGSLVYSATTKWSAAEYDLFFRGIEFGNDAKLAATGYSDPNRFQLFGMQPCRLDAGMELFGLDSVAYTQEPRLEPGANEQGETLGMEGPAPPEAVAGEIVSADCGFSISFAAQAIDIVHFNQKVVHYFIWANVLTITQIKLFLAQMRHTDDGPSAAKVSIFCIALQALTDAYDSFLHLCLGLSSKYMFNTIAVVSLFKFILFSLLEARYMLTIWRQRHVEAFRLGWEAVRRELSWLYSRFYGVLVVGLVLICNNLEHLDLVILGFQVYWVPQIIHDVWQGTRSAVTPSFIVGISATRVLPLLYLWGCPHGIFDGDLYPRLPGAPNPAFCLTVVLLQVAQVTVLLLQMRWGPRFFIPWICMPMAYNYHRQVPTDADSDCVICMSEIDMESGISATGAPVQAQVVTPCSHRFHEACLSQWMDVKMECPTCRTTLPPLIL